MPRGWFSLNNFASPRKLACPDAQEQEMKSEIIRYANGWLWLTFAIVILLIMAAGSGAFITGVYRDNPYFVAQAIGQDHISLFVVFPTLIISTILVRRGSLRGRIIWLGGIVYLVYTYAVAAFEVRFNLLFLVYVALLGCSLYALIGSLVTTDTAGIRACFTNKTPVKTISIYLAILAILFYFMWLSEIIPALMAGKIPQSVLDNGTPTNAVHVLDMAWILPAFGIAAVNLWHKRTLGYVLAGALLAYSVYLTLAILGMAIFMIQAGFSVVIPQLVVFAALLAINFGMLIWYMKNLETPHIRNDKP
jgi:hypothetical protein